MYPKVYYGALRVKYILIIGYPSSNWPFSKPRIKNMNLLLPKWFFQGITTIQFFFLSFAICSLILNAQFFILFALYTFQYAH